MTARLWPKSLHGQMLLALALALLLAQCFSAVLLYRAQHERREAALVHMTAMRLFSATRELPLELQTGDNSGMGQGPVPSQGPASHHLHTPEFFGGPRNFRLEHSPVSPARAGEPRDSDAERELRTILGDQNVAVTEVVVIRRAVAKDPPTLQRLERRAKLSGQRHHAIADFVLIAAIRKPGSSDWLVVRTPIPAYERVLLLTLFAQTLLIYAVLVGAIALILRRITRPLATLTTQIERFAETRKPVGQIAPEGPDDVRKLITAHNAMEARIAALLDEKDVMLGAIGHDLKTPLAALRVRIESVENDNERNRMAATIADIAQSLDDILSLARAGRSLGPTEVTDLAALLTSVVEEYEDIGEPVVLGDTARMALPLRATWLRRAIRNLIGNALRYGGEARVSMVSEGNCAVFRVDDNGPGIPEGEMARMLEPFTRGEASRNSETGGAGLGLALALAIAEQHGGTLALLNRHDATGKITGLTAELSLPLGRT
jgi:signal transduction histidine kinase